MQDTRRLYTDLAWLWPMWGDATVEYADFCRHIARLIRLHARRPVRTLLDIGCGGGKNVLNLKGAFLVTGLDISPDMLAQAERLNPECEFIQGDMRSFRLDRSFDAVLMDDAVSYMNSRSDLSAAFRTAYAHLNPGGVMIAGPDVTAETFRQNHTVCTPATAGIGPERVEAVFIENSYDPDPSDEQYESTVIYLLREDGRLRVETDRFTLGLFSVETWRRTLIETGFVIDEEEYVEGEDAYTVFVCVRPS